MILRINNLYKLFGGINAVNGCSFNVKEGSITSLIGPNGAGKTTVFNIISGLIKPDKGNIFFKDNDITGLLSHEIANLGISRTFQTSRLFKNMSIKDNLLLAKQVNDQELINTIKNVGIRQSIDKIAGDLSYGQQRLVEIARALLFNHELLLLDEPTAGVNPSVRHELKQIIRQARKHGCTILIIEHDMDFVMDISDEIIVLSQGKVLKSGKPGKIKNDSEVLEVYLGK